MLMNTRQDNPPRTVRDSPRATTLSKNWGCIPGYGLECRVGSPLWTKDRVLTALLLVVSKLIS